MSPLDEAIADLRDAVGDESIAAEIHRRVDADIVFEVETAIAVHQHAIEALEEIRERHLPADAAVLAGAALAELARRDAHPCTCDEACPPLEPACERWLDESAAHPAPAVSA